MSENDKARILIVDDETFIRDILSRWLSDNGYECVTANDGSSALACIENSQFELVLLDILMPGMSGMDLLTIIKSTCPDVAVIMVTAVDDRPTAILSLELGAYGYIVKPFEKNEILINVAGALDRRRLNALQADYERTLEREVSAKTAEIRQREEYMMFRLTAAVGYRSDETAPHIRRIGLFASTMARSLGWKTRAVEDIRLAAMLHDIGKIGIPDAILLKPGRLTQQEFEVVKRHPVIGAGIVGDSAVPLIAMAREIALYHHEKWDGSGYPEGLKREAIPEHALIVAIVDVYDALLEDRVYRAALPEQDVLSVMNQGKGKHFDPAKVEVFMEVLPELRRLRAEVGKLDRAPLID